MRADSDIKRDVAEELRWEPGIDAADIAIAVKNGVVALTGFATSYMEKLEAETAAKRVAGVTAVANDIEIRLRSIDRRPDPEIAHEAVSALKMDLPFSSDKTRVVVKSGWVRLEGEVEWHYQRQRAERAVRKIRGVLGVTDAMTIKPQISPADVKRKIEEAFKRSAEVDSQHVTVEAHDGEIILKGTVRSWAERNEAERAAWAAPGVRRVEDRLQVSF